MLGENIMKLTKARLKQIIREEMDLLALKEFNGALDEDDNITDTTGNTDDASKPVEPARKLSAREKTSNRAVDSGGKLSKEEFKNMLMTTLMSDNILTQDRKEVLVAIFGSAGDKLHTKLKALSAEQK